jgi:hypothetical protein
MGDRDRQCACVARSFDRLGVLVFDAVMLGLMPVVRHRPQYQ